jgi:hypothetical protein
MKRVMPGRDAEARRWHASLGQATIDQVVFAHVLPRPRGAPR